MIKKSYIISLGVIISFLGISATWVITKANQSIQELPPVIKKVPDFEMVSHLGKPFNQDSLINKISILDFIFTSCPGPCPTMSSNMRTLYKQYNLHPDLQFISISVDPEYDTQEVLKAYADANGVNDQRWKFLRADMKEVKKLSTDGFMFMSESLPAGHSVKFVLIDQNGDVRQYYNGTDAGSIAILRTHINSILKNIKPNA
jgi:protein SCO1/2